MTAVNLAPLAPKQNHHSAPLSPASLLQQYHHQLQATMTSSASGSSSEQKTSSSMMRPQPLLLNPDVLVRANLAERLSSQAGLSVLTAALQANDVNVNHGAMVNALAQQQYQQQLQRQLFQWQQMQQQSQSQGQPQAGQTPVDIIGMGINVPTPKTSNSASPKVAPLNHPQSFSSKAINSSPKQVPHKKNKMMQFGKPLMAPPRLASKICYSKKMAGLKRPAAMGLSLAPPMGLAMPMSSRPQQKRSKLSHHAQSYQMEPLARRVSLSSVSKKTLSSDELEFVEAARQLSHSPLASPKTLSPAMAMKALKAPPGLHF